MRASPAIETQRAGGGRFNNLLASPQGPIPRPKYDAQLDQWRSNGGAAVLLGDEGLGKTCLFLSWWHAKSSAEGDMPLTIFLPAKNVEQEPLISLCAKAISDRIEQLREQEVA